jgi:hypothetical protein
VSWPFAGHAGAWTASGFELGVAGIVWVNLQAARTTGDAASGPGPGGQPAG